MNCLSLALLGSAQRSLAHLVSDRLDSPWPASARLGSAHERFPFPHTQTFSTFTKAYQKGLHNQLAHFCLSTV